MNISLPVNLYQYLFHWTLNSTESTFPFPPSSNPLSSPPSYSRSNTMPKAPPPTVFTGNSLPKEGSFAYKQMVKMGWNPGEGLGEGGRGMKTFVKVDKQKDGVGIGGGGDGGQLGWMGTNDGEGLNNALGQLKAVSSVSPKKLAKAEKKKKKGKDRYESNTKSTTRNAGTKWSAAKDLRTKSTKDMVGIFGKAAGGDIFASMAATSTSTSTPDAESEDERKRRKQEKKEKKKRKAAEAAEEAADPDSSPPKEKKKSKKSKKE